MTPDTTVITGKIKENPDTMANLVACNLVDNNLFCPAYFAQQVYVVLLRLCVEIVENSQVWSCSLKEKHAKMRNRFFVQYFLKMPLV